PSRLGDRERSLEEIGRAVEQGFYCLPAWRGTPGWTRSGMPRSSQRSWRVRKAVAGRRPPPPSTAADMDEVVPLIKDTPCACAKGAVEVRAARPPHGHW